jgi:molecular chaperone GrpE (heat shock protein)
MDFIGLVKDSFEAVAHEVGAAYQRIPADATGRVDSDRSVRPIPADSRVPERATSSDDQKPGNNTDAIPDTTILSGSNASDAASIATAESPDQESREPSVDSAEVSGQLQLLADVMQQAALQLSAVAETSSDKGTDETQANGFDELRGEQAELRKLFESRIHSDEVQARSLERLHHELQASRKQIQRAEMAPLLKDIVFCHDFVTRELERDDASDQPLDRRSAFEVLGQMLLDVLFKYDVEPFRSESDEFDRTLQQCVRTEHTTELEKDRRIATYGLTGFRSEDRIIRREQVTVYRYRPGSEI